MPDHGEKQQHGLAGSTSAGPLPAPAAAPAGQQQQPAKQQQQQKQQLASDLLTGMVTSGVYTTLTYPVHRVKILLQTQDANPRVMSGKVPRYSFVHAFGRLAREQGVAALWRGNAPYLLRHIPSISMSFAFKDAFKAALPAPDPATAPWAALGCNAAAGAAAGALSLAIVYPFEFATVRLAADLGASGAERQYGKGMTSAWLGAMRAAGGSPLSCYQGFGVAVLSMAAYKSLYFGLYDTAKALLLQDGTGPGSSSTGATGQGGAAGGGGLELTPRAIAARTGLAAATTFTAASITYPLDIIRKRLIMAVGSGSSSSSSSSLGQPGPEAAAAAVVEQQPARGGQQQQQQQHGRPRDHARVRGAPVLPSAPPSSSPGGAPPLQPEHQHAALPLRFRACVARIYAREGIAGFYKFWAYDMFFRLGAGFLLVGYDYLRKHHQHQHQQEEHQEGEHLGAAL